MSEDAETSWQSGKMSVKIEINWKGETTISDRKGEIDLTYEYRVRSFVKRHDLNHWRIFVKNTQNAGAKNNVNVRALVLRSPLVNITKDFMLCLKAESSFQPSPVDIIDISGYSQPPAAQGLIEYVMGDVTSLSQVGRNLSWYLRIISYNYLRCYLAVPYGSIPL